MPPTPVQVIPQFYDFIAWAAGKIGRYSRTHRFTVGDRLMSGLLDVLDRLIEAQFDPALRAEALQRANATLERVRYLIRLSKDLNCLSLSEYEHACHQLLDTGRMVGGWSRYAVTRSAPGVL